MQSLKSKNTAGIVFTALFMLIVSIMAWLALEGIEHQTKKSIRASVQTVLQTTQESMYIWINQRKKNISSVASSQKLVGLTEQLLIEYDKGRTGKYQQNLTEVRSFLELLQHENRDWGFFIISPQMVNIASMDDESIGKVNHVYKHEQRKKLLSRVFNVNGEVVFIPTIPSELSSKAFTSRELDNTLAAFVAAPIMDEFNHIIAALVFRINPSNQFTRIAMHGRIGETGETYAFDESALLITESRFYRLLRQVGLVKPEGKGVLSIRICDPGGDLRDGYLPNNSVNERPLTLMAKSALSRQSGYNTNGYRNYRGVNVFGAWLWDDELRFGLATEIAEEEAMQTFLQTRTTIIVLLTATVILSILGLLLLLRSRIQHERQLKEAHDILEVRVYERTKDLKEARDNLEFANRRLEILATTDGLTELSNRRSLNDHLDKEWRRCSRDKKNLAVIMIDIDFFKNYNDEYGHQAGDECLKRVSLFLRGASIASRPGDMIARYGGEEFCIILSDISLTETTKIAKKIKQLINKEKIEHKATKVQRKKVLTLSLGVAIETEFESHTPGMLVNRADQALYTAKSLGRNQVVVYQEKKKNEEIA